MARVYFYFYHYYYYYYYITYFVTNIHVGCVVINSTNRFFCTEAAAADLEGVCLFEQKTFLRPPLKQTQSHV